MSKLKTIRNLDLAGKRVLMRVDFNVPQDGRTGAITSTLRIAATLSTIRMALDHGASVVLISHLGRPEGERVPRFSLKPVAAELQQLLCRPVAFAGDCVGPAAAQAAAALKPGDVLLLENLRFHLEEEVKIKLEDGTVKVAEPQAVAAFRASLSRLGDVYVNDAFGAVHRAHSSIVGVSLSQKAAGLLLELELNTFAALLKSPRRPLLAILGGAKIKDKIPLIHKLLDLTNELIIAGGMAFTFKQVLEGMPIGNSRYDVEGAKIVPELMAKARVNGVKVTFPVDFVCGNQFKPDAALQSVDDQQGIPAGWMGLDVGPRSREAFAEVIARCSTIVWNGPPGVFEWDNFAAGTQAMAEAIAGATKQGATTIIGGGDTATAAEKFRIHDQVTHCSTGGGASLKLMEGKVLPGVAFLES